MWLDIAIFAVLSINTLYMMWITTVLHNMVQGLYSVKWSHKTVVTGEDWNAGYGD